MRVINFILIFFLITGCASEVYKGPQNRLSVPLQIITPYSSYHLIGGSTSSIIFISKLDKSGCLIQRQDVKEDIHNDKIRSIEIDINEELAVGYVYNSGNFRCSKIISFTPKVGKKYKMETISIEELRRISKTDFASAKGKILNSNCEFKIMESTSNQNTFTSTNTNSFENTFFNSCKI